MCTSQLFNEKKNFRSLNWRIPELSCQRLRSHMRSTKLNHVKCHSEHYAGFILTPFIHTLILSSWLHNISWYFSHLSVCIALVTWWTPWTLGMPGFTKKDEFSENFQREGGGHFRSNKFRCSFWGNFEGKKQWIFGKRGGSRLSEKFRCRF